MAVSQEEPMTTSTWQHGIPGVPIPSMSNIRIFWTLPSYCRGYLHVRVQTGVRQQWCRYVNNHDVWKVFTQLAALLFSTNGTYYVAPIPFGQTLVQVVAYQPPPGYVVVPMEEVS